MSRTKRIQHESPVSDRAQAVCSRGPVLPTPRAAKRALVRPVTLTCDGVEVTQSIQDMPGHTVPIVAQKRTVVRVYLSASSASKITVRGVLWARHTSPRRRWHIVPSVGTATIDPSENGKLRPKRESEAKSLNFILPDSICAAGQVELRLVSVVRVAPSGLLIPPANARRKVSFVASAPLRVRIVGIRFQGGTPPQVIEPSPLDFTLIRSWLGRAYPVASVEWSQVTMAAPQAWPFDAARINAFLRGIRANDIIGGVDARTHYFGLAADGGGGFFMRGLDTCRRGQSRDSGFKPKSFSIAATFLATSRFDSAKRLPRLIRSDALSGWLNPNRPDNSRSVAVVQRRHSSAVASRIASTVTGSIRRRRRRIAPSSSPQGDCFRCRG